MTDLIQRPRRLRKSPALRAMFEETTLSLNDLVLPISINYQCIENILCFALTIMLRYRRMVQLFFPLSPNVDIYNLWRKTRIKLIKGRYFNMLQIMLFLIHTRYKYQKHKPDKYLINIQQSLNYSIYSSATKGQKIITKSYK